MNGDCSISQTERKCQLKRQRTIRLLAVATFQKSHGYERVIKGLAQYYRGSADSKIELYLVGNGEETVKYKKMVQRYELEPYVILCGRKIGSELDYLYESMDIALGPFGLYKRKIFKSSSLKVREYLAKGMPIISGCHEDAFERGKPGRYYLEFPNDNTPIDIKMIVDFYKSIYETDMNRKQIHKEIREYAKKTVDLSVTMQPVIEYIRG